MEKLKLRIWDKITKQLIYLEKTAFVNYEIDDKNTGFELTFDGLGKESSEKKWLRKPKDYVLQQFTGLKDKNGVEIYEGDVLKLWIDRYLQSSNYIVKDLRELYSMFNTDDGYYRVTDCEIVGNIFENPELLT